MAIKVKELETLSNTYRDNGYLYKDLALDIEQSSYVEPGYSTSVRGTDIKVSYDLAAIKNSLQNLFNTLPGQRFLFPEYGLDFYQFLFSPITELNGQILGDKIKRSIKAYEPRVRPVQVNVTLDPDNSQYFINIVIEILQLNLMTGMDFSLDTRKQTFIYLPTSRNK
jgi:phage baseplate assembly protein W